VDKQKRYWIWLSSLTRISSKNFYDIIASFEDAQNVWDSVKLNTTAFDFLSDEKKACIYEYHTEGYIDHLLNECEKKNIIPITLLDDAYPVYLKEIHTPPPVIYVKGNLSGLTKKSIAIVGTRRCTRKSLKYTEQLAKDLALNDVCVISGMARGIDTAAHTGALNANGKTYAVLGSGTDIVYPTENQALYERIQENGAIISEYVPGTQPLSMNFPARNRIISGLSQATLIVESMMKGGANITMKYATDQGRDVMAIPGAPYENTSQLPNFIIKNGGIMVENADDVLREYGWKYSQTKSKKAVNINLQLDFFEQRIYNLLLQGDFNIEEIENNVEIEPEALYSSLSMMELKGIIERLPGNSFGIKS